MRATRPRRGFTYLGLLFIVGLMSLTAAMASVVWSLLVQREQELELVRIGQEFEAAIERYHGSSKGHPKRYPSSLADLLRDDRVASVERPLRRIFVDPMTGRPEWGLIRLADGGIVGVYSLSGRKTLQRVNVGPGIPAPSGSSYRDWRFVAPSARAAAASAAAPGQ